jgi:hypothetical protein
VRFPPNDAIEEKSNAAIQLYGRRFYADQTPLEYLAELLLVYASPKGPEEDDSTVRDAKRFSFVIGDSGARALYWPKDGAALKLLAFFPGSKLDTRHEAHVRAYREALEDLKQRIEGDQEEQEETIRLLQGLLSGFVGIAKNRTWATQTFLPATEAFLSRELDWLHSEASKDAGANDWETAKKHFASDRHNFLARGGELLFLQLAHLFSISKMPGGLFGIDNYKHAIEDVDLPTLRGRIEAALRRILEEAASPLNNLLAFLERSLDRFSLYELPKKATLGWVPTSTLPEAFLFAWEMQNITSSNLPDLEKLDLLQYLCSMHVLRTLCCEASRKDSGSRKMAGFFGNYAWVLCTPEAVSGSAERKLAQSSFAAVEGLLYRVLLRQYETAGSRDGSLTEARKHGFEIFRRLGKQIGLIIPRTGKGQRFVLPPHLLRFLVAALLRPGERIRLNRFFERVFAHYGIALGGQQLAAALAWEGMEGQDFAVATDTQWIEETLRQGGLLVELSDAVSIVRNPAGSSDVA